MEMLNLDSWNCRKS